MPTVSPFVSTGYSIPPPIHTPSPSGTVEIQPGLAFQVYDTRLTFWILLWFMAYSIGIISFAKGVSRYLAWRLRAVIEVGETSAEGNFQLLRLQRTILHG